MKKITFILIIIQLLCLSLFYYSCAKNSLDNATNEELIGIWQLDSVKYKQDNIVKEFPDTLGKMILVELTNSSIVNLTGYCNSGLATYTVNDSKMKFDNISLTEKACPFIGGQWEGYLFELINVPSFDLNGNKLSLLTDSEIDLFLSKHMN